MQGLGFEVAPFYFGSKENGLRIQYKPEWDCKEKGLADHLAASHLLREWPGWSALVSIWSGERVLGREGKGQSWISKDVWVSYESSG